MKRLYLIGIFLVMAGAGFAQADAGKDKVNCFGTGVTIGGTGDPSLCYSWSPTTGLDNPNTLHPKASPIEKTTYTLTVIGKDFSSKSTDVVIVDVLKGFTITLLQDIVCDGEQVNIKLNPVPATIKISDFIDCISNAKFTSTPTAKYVGGNPAGSVTLLFNPINNNAETSIQRALWYSTQVDDCNYESQYQINASVIINGVTINSNNSPMLTAKVNPKNNETDPNNCFYGVTNFNDVFSGTPNPITSEVSKGIFQTVVRQGTFKKYVTAKEPIVIAPINSQFYTMIKNEEYYHKGQLEGTNGNTMIDLFLAENVINAANAAGPFTSTTQAGSMAAANAAITTAIDIEINRSVKIFESPERECAMESEAKAAIGASYAASFRCTYVATGKCK